MRVVCGAVALSALGGMVLGGAFASNAAAGADSSLTIGWTGDTSSAAPLQPARATGSGTDLEHNEFYNEFKNLKVTVAQTQNLIDQAVRVDVSGFPGGTQQAADPTGKTWSTAMNFMQAMQCWGDPSSPTFKQTCEWGGRFVNNNGLGDSVYGDNVYRVAAQDVSPDVADDVAQDVKFQPNTGDPADIVTGRQEYTDKTAKTGKTYPILQYFTADSSNEVLGARIDGSGSGSFDFEMQTNIEAPHLGCGRDSASLNCYLVLVPRGTVYGGKDSTASCSSIGGSNHTYTAGLTPAIQAGSPLDPGCDYWDNRIVVPLKFNQVAGVCPSGAEVDVVGSQLAISAMSSWQPKLCTTAGSTYSFSTGPDSIGRAQLLEGKTNLTFTSYPITRSELQDPFDQTAFDTSTVSYAPVAVGAAAVSFLADGRNGQIHSLNLSPRLLAKLLTQSYLFEVPNDGNDAGTDDFAQLNPANLQYNYLWQDPEFQALNSNWGDFTATNPSIVLPGPSDSDSVAQIWKWIQSDSDARDFLNGKPDTASGGMTVNPNYLPVGNPAAQVPVFDPATGNMLPGKLAVGFKNLDGSPQSLATTPLNYFPKADQATVPHKLGTVQSGTPTTQYGSIQASPYVDDFVKSAVVTFRANPGAKTAWDQNVVKPGSDLRGDWVSGGPQVPGQRFVISITDAAAIARYDLDPVGLRAANGTAVTTPTATTMAAAISSGLVATTNPAVKQVDPAKVSAAGYPLTTVVYAAVNLTASNTAARIATSNMIKYVAGAGQTQGTQVGQLPIGYLPLTTDLQSQASTAATAIASYTGSSTSSSDDGVNISGNTGGFSTGSGIGSDASVGGAASSAPQISSIEASKVGLTPASSTVPVLQVLLALALGAGFLGAVFAPAVMRGVGRR